MLILYQFLRSKNDDSSAILNISQVKMRLHYLVAKFCLIYNDFLYQFECFPFTFRRRNELWIDDLLWTYFPSSIVFRISVRKIEKGRQQTLRIFYFSLY